MFLSKSQRKSIADDLLRLGLNEVWLRLNDKYIRRLTLEFDIWLEKDQQGVLLPSLALTEFMLFKVEQSATSISQLKRRGLEFDRRFLRAIDAKEAEQHILELSKDLGASNRQLSLDKKAFKRWFDRDAILERFNAELSSQLQALSFYLDRLGWIYSDALSKQEDLVTFWQKYLLEDKVRPLFVFVGDNRIRVAAFNCLSRALHSLPHDKIQNLVSDASIQYIYRAALQSTQDVQIQRQALSLLARLSRSSLVAALNKRLTNPKAGDDFFVRRHGVRLIGQYSHRIPELNDLLPIAAKDPSAAVRQVVADNLIAAPTEIIHSVFSQLIIDDLDPAVRGASVLVFKQLLEQDFELVLKLLTTSLNGDKNSFVLRVLLKVAVDALTIIDGSQLQKWIQELLPVINHLHLTANEIQTRRYAAQAKEWFWCYSHEDNQTLYRQLLVFLSPLKEGQRKKLSKAISYQNELQLARCLSLIAQTGYGFTLEKNLFSQSIRKGDKLKFRFWRFLFELGNASTDKRQAHSHMIGRHFLGRLRAPSAIMCELAETKVPGEPLHLSNEGGWRPYLPLVDDVLSALDQAWKQSPYQIVTSEGVTEINPPSRLFNKILAQIKLIFNFESFAKKRNWTKASQKDPKNYLNSIEKLGFKISHLPHQFEQIEASTDPMVNRFFGALLPFNISISSDQVKDYFFSVYENTLLHLGIFLVAVSSYFFGRHVYLNQQMNKARKSIPLVIGGWGTRGKSGTERLKAALFNALGFSVVSKTTGCEAMFLHSTPFGKLREMFLFRPYDKATIWEQVDVVKLSAKLDCEVFLWECMGLTPSYVHVLQKDWMRDDIATITNTYPDHEDLQGPAGHEIPRVMTNFIPKSSVLITTEEQMLPILAESAVALNTKMIAVGWLEAGLLTSDVLQRFPYEEHPYNIALVLAMAKQLGIDTDFALKEMADRVVADLGVLKTYPLTQVNNRQLEFVMGMSANEKFGSMGNWTRMGFDQHDLSVDPQIWVTTVINNRADRVPRSRVFAAMIVADISADRHILIGNNLQGLMGYIEEAWLDNLASLALFDESGEETLQQRLFKLAKKLRVPVDEREVKGRYLAMLQGLGLEDKGLDEFFNAPEKIKAQLEKIESAIEPDEIINSVKQDQQLFAEFQTFEKRLSEEKDQQKLQKDFEALAWSWFSKKLVVVENYFASGNDVIDVLVKHTPPGLKTRIMGMQNIKGTGLDYVYRWQAWEACFLACQMMLDKETAIALDGVRTLAKFKEFGPLSKNKVETTIKQIKDQNWAQSEEVQSELVMITSNLDLALQKIKQDAGTGNSNQGLSGKIAEYIEAFLDAGDAVKRRKRANQIYKDLQDKRISHERAALELQAINKRQKGGWAGEYMAKLNR